MYLDGTVDNKIKFYNGYGKGAAGREITFYNSGNVGIGTTAPAAKLEISFGATGINNGVASLTNISGLSGAFSIIHNQDSVGTGNQVGQFFGHAGSPGLLSGIVSRKNSGTWATNLDFYVNNLTGVNVGNIQKAMTIDSNGNLGIGTDSPGAKLDIDGGYFRVKGDQPVGAYYYGIMYDGTNLRGTTQTNILYSGSTIAANTTVTDYAGLRIEAPSTAASGAVITNNYGIYQASSAQKNYFGGNVGIGTASPAQKLDVNGAIRFTPNTADTNYSADIAARYDSAHPFELSVKNNGSSAEYFGVYADAGGANNRVAFPTGNVGIGTSSPYFPLHVQGATGSNGEAKNNILAFYTTSATTGTGGGIAFC